MTDMKPLLLRDAYKNKPKFNYAELSFLTQLGLQLSLFLAWSGLVWPVLAWYGLF